MCFTFYHASDMRYTRIQLEKLTLVESAGVCLKMDGISTANIIQLVSRVGV